MSLPTLDSQRNSRYSLSLYYHKIFYSNKLIMLTAPTKLEIRPEDKKTITHTHTQVCAHTHTFMKGLSFS